MAEETQTPNTGETPTPTPEAPAAKKPPAKATGDAAPAKAPAKKEKAPALEDKPFGEFIQQDYLPALKAALAKRGVEDLELTFTKEKFPIQGFSSAEESWQVIGKFKQGQRQFNVYFPKEDIQAQRGFSCAENKTKMSTLEPFLIDERKITLDLLVFGVLQRLNGQKWLSLN
jgi:hypothetical protein